MWDWFFFSIKFIVLEGHSLCYTSQLKGESRGGECPQQGKKSNPRRLQEPYKSFLPTTQWWQLEGPGYPNLLQVCSPLLPLKLSVLKYEPCDGGLLQSSVKRDGGLDRVRSHSEGAPLLEEMGEIRSRGKEWRVRRKDMKIWRGGDRVYMFAWVQWCCRMQLQIAQPPHRAPRCIER